MNKKYFLIAYYITLGSLSAQSFIGKLNPLPNNNSNNFANDTIKIFAVMVSFQEDKDGATFGNGKFGSIYSQSYGTDILDPLPHDKNYFEQHLTFVKNYFNKVSKGKQEVNFTVFQDTFSVSKTMRNYSPVPGSNDYTPVGEFAKEVWQKVPQIDPFINFSDYDIFLIFHAGVGRDITLPGSLGNERDLPSLYLSDNALKEIFNDDLTGLPVNKFGKTNTMIIPETESRELESISGTFLFEITINGLLVASIASHLGLPDLFDTETGLSAIGRFGLMDGQSIFAYNGCFPPEPSAWEKIDLGWIEATEIPQENLTANLTANLSATLSDTVILKIPINSTEYYLIENRQRDVKDKGANLTYVVNGNTITKRLNDTTGFYSYDTDSLSGVVVDVDEFDWALPGNGIVIWHIDESVINEKRSTNKINVDKDRRGVDVEEADGVQDIGEKYITVFGDEVIGEGTDEDFWFRGNKTKLYKNIFSKSSRPNTNTNSGANSLITIKNFSTNSSKMSFSIEFGDSIIKPLFNYVLTGLSDNKSITTIEDEKLLLAINSDSLLKIFNGDSIVYTESSFSDFKPAIVRLNNKTYILGIHIENPAQPITSQVNMISYDGLSISEYRVDLPIIVTTTPVVRNIAGSNQVLFGTSDGKIFIYNFETLLSGNFVPIEITVEENVKVTQVSFYNTKNYAIAQKDDIGGKYALVYSDGNVIQFPDEILLKIVSTIDSKGNNIAIVSSIKADGYYYHIIEKDKVIKTITASNLQSVAQFSISDLKNDGNNYILTTSGNQIFAMNISGAFADNFPFRLNDGDEFIGLPLAADIEGDEKSEIIAFTKNGLVYAIDGGSGKIVNGFPISYGNQLLSDAALFYSDNKISLAEIDINNQLNSWGISSISSIIDWAEIFGNNSNSCNLGEASQTQVINSFFPSNRAYNYPNPVYDGQTAIRYFVNEDSKINIKIFDIAGDFVAELNADAQGGLDNETIWNVDNIQSGVYLANIEATGASGKTENAVIKIAVVK